MASINGPMVGLSLLILGRAAVIERMQANIGIAPPSINIPNPRITDDICPTRNLVLADVNVDGNCETTNRVNDETNITDNVDIGNTMLDIS